MKYLSRERFAASSFVVLLIAGVMAQAGAPTPLRAAGDKDRVQRPAKGLRLATFDVDATAKVYDKPSTWGGILVNSVVAPYVLPALATVSFSPEPTATASEACQRRHPKRRRRWLRAKRGGCAILGRTQYIIRFVLKEP